MKFAAYYDQTGEVVTVTAFRGTDAPLAIRGLSFVVLSYEPDMPGHVVGGEYTPRPVSPGDDHDWDTGIKQWVFSQARKDTRLAKLAFDALDQIDQAAGTVRMRYITSVPGQAETYQRKEQQAREWKDAGFVGTPPVFVAAEADALGQDPVDVADYIIETADQWGNFKGPQIEATRRKWKVAIEQAGTDEVAIVAARDAGIADLMTL